MNNTNDERLQRMLQQLADQSTAHDVPVADQSWSQIQFRLRYRSRSRDGAYKSTAMNLGIALWTLILLVSQARVGRLAVEILLLLAVAAIAALVLYVATYRAIRS